VTYDVPNGRPDVPFILTEEKISVTPMGEQMRFAGTLELAGFDASVDPYRVRPILDVAAEYVSDLDPTGPETVDPWVGFRPCTPDGLPLVGRVPQYDNVVLATGHCMLGISLAPVTGQLVGDILNGESPDLDVSPLRLDRFN
jgi:D-amino-acid dehydrogenase